MRIWRQNNKRESERGTILMEAVICLPVLLLVSLGVAQFAHISLCRQLVVYAAYSSARAALPVGENKIAGGMSEEEAAALYAAKRICAPISFTQTDGQSAFQRNWLRDVTNSSGIIKGSGGVHDTIQSTTIFYESDDGWKSVAGWRSGKVAIGVTKPDGNQWSRAVTVRMDVPLLVPFAGPIIGKCFSIFQGGNMGIYDVRNSTDELSDSDQKTFNLDYREFTDFFYSHISLCETAVIGKPFRVVTTGNLYSTTDPWD